MNKKSNYIVILLAFLIVICGCKNTKELVNIKKIETNEPVKLKMNNNLKKVTGIKFPFTLILNNSSTSGKYFIKINYNYESEEKGVGIEVYSNGKRVSNNKKKTIPGKQSLNYLVYTRHFTDSTQATQQQLQPYIEKMLEENKDTLHIGTVSEFKTKHAALFERLTKNDSISIQFLDGKELGERITVPVNW